MSLIQRILGRLSYETKFGFADLHLPRYYNAPALETALAAINKDEDTDVWTVAFNTPKVIDYQIRAVKRFIPLCRHTVFDNSSDVLASNQIRQICCGHQVGYVRLPRQPFLSKGMGSYSHAIACNWIFKHFLPDAHSIIMLLDHDIFPITNICPEKMLEHQPYYGQMFDYGRYHVKYLWPGFFVANKKFLQQGEIDFRPSRRLDVDTGGLNYKMLDIDSHPYYRFANHKVVMLNQGSTDRLGQGYSLFDDSWLHCWNASNYAGSQHLEQKMDIIYRMLDDILTK